MDVDPLTSELSAVDRTLAEHENDILLTMAHAPNVTAILTPDAPGTYVVLVTVADACNATASALTNATAMCSHRPVAAVTNETDGVRPWDQKLAMAHVSETYAVGWWPAHALKKRHCVRTPRTRRTISKADERSTRAAGRRCSRRIRRAAKASPCPSSS